jgi:predicted DNA binding CopG/RHH family protein
LEQALGGMGRNYMRNHKEYTDAPAAVAEELRTSITVKDFLPSPETIAAMIAKEKTVPVTMKLKRKTVDRYKMFARKKGVKYQSFVSALLDLYAQKL